MTNFLDDITDENPRPKKAKPPFKPKKKTGQFHNESTLEQESRDGELNNLNRGEVTEDFGDSNFADRV